MFTMDKKDSMDLKDRIELLLKIMTNGCAEDSKNVTGSDYVITSDESDSDSESDDPLSPVSNENENEDYSDVKVRLNKFFEDHVEKTEKHLPSNVASNAGNDFQFEGKMYRVIPIWIDKKVSKLKNSNEKWCVEAARRQR